MGSAGSSVKDYNLIYTYHNNTSSLPNCVIISNLLFVIVEKVDPEVHLESRVGLEWENRINTGMTASKQEREKSDTHKKLSARGNAESLVG